MQADLYVEVGIKRWDLGQRLEEWRGRKRRTSVVKSSEQEHREGNDGLLFQNVMKDMFKGQSMPQNKHKHPLIEVLSSKHAQGGEKKKKGNMPSYNCTKHFLPRTDIPSVDKHLQLY